MTANESSNKIVGEENVVSTADESKPKYESPTVRVMNEEEALSAFQVTAAGSAMWWSV